ncbi:hypothetical protein ABLE68_03635 [Nocardioides sp. CN2-186]|uniref:hypothetical protein n=1 Tax=Nocardioides tweenelious TaxID=3156607 RepID=UPI0032B56150
MIATLGITDPTTALLLTHLDVTADGRVRSGRADLRRRQRRHLRAAKLRKLLA